MTKKNIIIATGGTGGHIFPTLSLANFLINKNFDVKLTSDKRGLEYLKVNKNLNITEIPSSPVIKKIFEIMYFYFNYNFFYNKIVYIFII